MIARRLPSTWLALAAAVGALALAAGGAAAATHANPAANLVLAPHDVGGSYKLNPSVSGPRTFGQITVGDSQAVQRLVRQDWIGGMQSGFNGVSVPWGIISLVDVFRSTSQLTPILQAWQADYVRISGGKRLAVPKGFPGAHGVLVRGHIFSSELLIYIWQHDRTIASVDVTGNPSNVPIAELLRLSRLQDRKLTAAR